MSKYSKFKGIMPTFIFQNWTSASLLNITYNVYIQRVILEAPSF